MFQIAIAWLWAKGISSSMISAAQTAYLDDVIGALNVTLTDSDIKNLSHSHKYPIFRLEVNS